MNCDTCQALLVDLACGELQEDVREAAQRHVSTCHRCSDDMRTLRDGLGAAQALPILPPPPEVRVAVLRAAREHVEKQQQASAQQAADSRMPWWRTLLSAFGQLATSPQVAMATVLLLMIAVGLYYLPAADAPEAALSPLRVEDELQAEPLAEGAASATTLPTDDEAPPARETARAGAQSREEAVSNTAGAETGRKPSGPPGSSRMRPKPTKGGVAKPPARRRAQRAAPKKQRKRAEKSSSQGVTEDLDGLLQQPMTEQKAEGAPAQRSFAPAPPSGSALGAGAPAEAEASAKEDALAPLAQARRAASQGRHAEAVRLSERALKTPGSDVAAAHFTAARSYRALGRCADAVRHYGALRASTRRYPRAWIEGALCLRKLGRAATAERWLTEAESMPKVRDEAARLRAQPNEATRPASSAADTE